jgi:tetratricopeptide (TPR) repeat protein
MRVRTLPAALLLACLPGLTPPGSPAAAPPPGPTAARIARWIAQLGDDDFNLRQEASRQLRAAGRRAEPALARAADSRDAEVRKRARAILADFRWGIYPDTPPAVVKLVREYQAATLPGKRTIVRGLLAAGPAGCRALVKVAHAESDPPLRHELFTTLSVELVRSLPGLLLDGSLDTVEELLEVVLTGDPRRGAANYAAHALLTGKLGARIAEFEALARRHPPGKAQAEVLAYLYRARGDLAAARKAAATAGREELVEALLVEAGAWKELAARKQLVSFRDPLEQQGFRAAFHRLAGNRKEFAELIQAIRKVGETNPGGGNRLLAAKLLFLNAQTGEALDLFGPKHREHRLRFEVLVAQQRIREARAVVAEARKEKSPVLPALEILEARTLHELAEKQPALAVLQRYAAEVKPGTDAAWFEDLVATAVAIDRPALAHEVTAKVLEVSRDEAWPFRLLRKLYPERGEEGAALWFFLRQQAPRDSVAAVYARLRDLLDGKTSAKDLEALVRAAASGTRPPGFWPALGDAALRAGQEKLADRCWREDASAVGTFKRADVLTRQKQWDEAAKLYALACMRAAADEMEDSPAAEAYPSALALFLSGHALVQAGQTAQGRERMRQAHLLPLASSPLRYFFAAALAKRGFKEDARRAFDLLCRLGEPNLNEFDSLFTGEGFRDRANRALKRKEYLTAADDYEKHFVRGLRATVNFSRPAAYIAVPGPLLRWRTLGLLAAGRVDEALHAAALASASLPGSIDLALDLVPALERAGRKKEAGQMFAGALTTHEELGRDYPRAAWPHNQAAWLCACCKRELPRGLEHARKAVALAPDRSAYHDTLAEVLFQLGRTQEAIAAGKKAVALSPKRQYYRKQLKRFEAGNPAAERPAEEE